MGVDERGKSRVLLKSTHVQFIHRAPAPIVSTDPEILAIQVQIEELIKLQI